ncbi:MAG: hypothetical protein QXY90_06935 [Candidatus Anstonellales archaeon]
MNKEPTKTGFFITLGLMVLTWIVTIWLFHYLTNSQTRSETFGFTLTFVCFLELMAFGYFAFLFLPALRKTGVWAIYPVMGIIIGLYVLVSLVIVTGYNLLSIFVLSPKTYFTALTIESLIFLIILGSIIILNAYKKVEDIHIEKEKRELANLSVNIQEAYQKFLGCRGFLDIQTYREVEANLRKLKERFSFCTPFGRSDAEVKMIEEQIQTQIASLAQLVGAIPSASKEKLDSVIKDINHFTIVILHAVERREKLLIK